MTDNYYKAQNNNIKLANITDYEKEMFEKYVEKTRHYIELFTLYRIFRTNIKNLNDAFIIDDKDTIVSYHNQTNERFSDQELAIVINTFTNNIFSSGKTLIESMEVYLKSNINNEVFKKFRDTISSVIYDKTFSYKLLTYLRNYAQHGHVPVQVSFKRASFNLNDILIKPHTSRLNKAVHKEMEEIRGVIADEFGDIANISYMSIILEIIYNVTFIYIKFLSTIKADLKKIDRAVRNIVIKRTDIRNDDGLIYYDADELYIHAFDIERNCMRMFSENKKEVSHDLIIDKSNLNAVKIKQKNTRNKYKN